MKPSVLRCVVALLVLVGCHKLQEVEEPKQELTSANPNPNSAAGFDTSMEKLAKELSEGLEYEAEKKLKVAVVDFTNADGSSCGLGSVIAEEMTTKLFRSGRYQVIERRQLKKILEEQNMSMTDLIDPNSAAQLGKVLGAQGIVTGTLTQSAEQYRVNARVILVQSATLVSAADVKISRTTEVNQLGVCSGGSNSVAAVDNPKPVLKTPEGSEWVPPITPNKPTQFFYEDFKSVPVGNIPEGWLGAEHLAVKEGSRGSHILTCFEGGPANLTIPTEEFPSDYRLEFVITQSYWKNVGIKLGTLNAGVNMRVGTDYEFSAYINKSENKIGKLPKDSPVIIALEKRGDVFRLIIDGGEVVVARYSTTEKISNIGISIITSGTGYGSAGTCSKNPPILHKISVTKL